MNRSQLFDIVIDMLIYNTTISLKTNDQFLRVIAFLKKYPSENVEDLRLNFLNHQKIKSPYYNGLLMATSILSDLNPLKTVSQRYLIVKNILNLPTLVPVIMKYDYYFESTTQFTLEGHRHPVVNMIEPRNNKLITGSLDRDVIVWNLDTQEIQLRIDIKSIPGIIIKIDDNTIAVALTTYQDNRIKVYNSRTGNKISTFMGHKSQISFLLYYEGRLISGSFDKTIKIWNLKTQTLIDTLQGHTEWITCGILISEDKLVTGSSDATLRIWDLSSGQCEAVLTSHKYPIRDIVYHSEAKKIISASNDGVLKVWELAKAKEVASFRFSSYITSNLLISGNNIICGFEDGRIRIWNLRNSTSKISHQIHRTLVNKIDMLPNGNIVSMQKTLNIMVWDSDLNLVLDQTIGNESISTLLVLKDGRVACGVDYKNIKILI